MASNESRSYPTKNYGCAPGCTNFITCVC